MYKQYIFAKKCGKLFIDEKFLEFEKKLYSNKFYFYHQK